MSAYEYVGNLHVHTPYSDGEGTHSEVAEAAMLAGLDFVVFTDHNLLVCGIDGYYGDEERGYVLLLAGEEVHDVTRQPQCNHVLIYDAGREMSRHATSLESLLEAVNVAGGLAFIAHPDDHAIPWLGEPAIPWLDRAVEGYTGLELWNTMSRFKDYLQRKSDAIKNVFKPEEVITGPNPRTLALWDQLLARGQRVVAIGGADAHGTRYTLGPIAHTVFPYDFLFSCVNTHVLTKAPLSGDAASDRRLIFQALRHGRAFVGYEIPGETRGFRFTGQGQNASVVMGEQIHLGHGVTLQVRAPARARLRVICDGEVVAEETNVENLTHVVREPGAYRAEAWRVYEGVERAWIFSNPIYVVPSTTRLRY